MIKAKNAHACAPWEVGTKDPRIKESGIQKKKKRERKYGRTTENIYMEIHILGTGKEMRIQRKRQ